MKVKLGRDLKRVIAQLQPLSFQAQAAATTIYCATAPEMEHIGGYYFSNCLATEPCDQAKDPDAGQQLWDLSERLIKNGVVGTNEFIGMTY